MSYVVVVRTLFEAQEIVRYDAREVAEEKAQLLNRWTRRPPECLPLYGVLEVQDRSQDDEEDSRD